MRRTRVLSGIRATGDLHLGNYLGAVRQWVATQSDKDCYYFIADLHGLTEIDQGHSAPEFEHRRLKTAATFLACGLDPDQVTLFFQSAIPSHTELTWYVSSVARVGELERMTQWKDKAGTNQAGSSAGLFIYPVLMAADILLYDADEVPVGDDQRQHVEFARDWAGRFNSYFGETFILPKAVIPEEGARVMDLQRPEDKMSKSGSDRGVILLDDDDDTIAAKFRRAVTDSGSGVEYTEGNLGVANLLEIFAALSEISLADAVDQFEGRQYSELKQALADAAIEVIRPIRSRTAEIMDDRAELRRLMAIGTTRAALVAEATTVRARAALGVENV